MPDQAEELRRLVARATDAILSDPFYNETPETAEAYRAKLDRLRPMIPRGKSPFQSIGAELAKVERLPTLGFLWTTLESDLERWVRVGGFDKPNVSTEALAEFWEMMQRRKEQV